MRYLLLLLVLVAGCSTPHVHFVKTTLGKPCKEECTMAELDCVLGIRENGSYLFLGPFVIGGGTTATSLRSCELYGKLCEMRCEAPAP